MSATAADAYLESSFRDPSGFVFSRDGRIYRQINLSYRADYEQLMTSGLYRSLVDDGLLVPHEEIHPPDGLAEGAFRVIAPEPIPFISYPYEWSFPQLQSAALATLAIQRRAREHDMSLKDASGFNIQFVGHRPVLIDTLSFEHHRDGAPWVAYRQFCQHFLAPLALMSMRDPCLGQLTRRFVDGIPLELASKLLPARTWLSLSMLTHIHLHARSQRRHAQSNGGPPSGRLSRDAEVAIIESLRSGVETLRPARSSSHWATYYETRAYSPEAMDEKSLTVARYIDRLRPATVWDLGANTGAISRLASQKGAYTIAIDSDPESVEINYREAARTRDTRILPLVVDLTNPSPRLGWHHRERLSLLERGPADLALALALVHHLAIGNNVPLPRVASFLADAGRWAVVEFVPKEDGQVQRLLQSRTDIFDGYTQAGFERAFAERFTLEDRRPLPGSVRVLYLYRRREA